MAPVLENPAASSAGGTLTMHAADIRMRTTPSPSGSLDYYRYQMEILQSDNTRLVTENDLLKKQMDLLKENINLKVASLAGSAMSWPNDEPGSMLDLPNVPLPGVAATPVSNVTSSAGSLKDFSTQPEDSESRSVKLQSTSENEYVDRGENNESHGSTHHPSCPLAPGTQLQSRGSKRLTWSVTGSSSNHSTGNAKGRKSPMLNPAARNADRATDPDSRNESSGMFYSLQAGHVWTNPSLTSANAGPQGAPPAPLSASTPAWTPGSGSRNTPTYERIPVTSAATPNITSTSTPQRHVLDASSVPSSPASASVVPASGDSELPAGLKHTRRLIGEIAFQLDRRILAYVFNVTSESGGQRKRFYGYTLENIPEKIMKNSGDTTTGRVNKHKHLLMHYRYNYVLRTLGPLGYRIDKHAEIAGDLVNKYGLLPVSERSQAEPVHAASKEKLARVVKELVDPPEVADVAILLECLAALARDDRRPMFFV